MEPGEGPAHEQAETPPDEQQELDGVGNAA
jgi:hypothetical protein